MRPPTEMGLVSAAGALGVSFQSLRAAQFQLYRSSGSACTVGVAGCTLVATITAEAAASAGPHTATFGQRAGGTYWVRGQSCLTSGARSSGGVGGAADTPGPRVDTGACGAWSALSPSSAHTAPTVTPEPQCTLTVVARPAVGGTVSGGRTVNCSASTNLTAKAKPKPGYRFVRWSGDGTGTGASARTVTMETDRSVTAHFAVTTEPPPERCTLTVRASPPEGGTVSDDTTVDCSASTNLTAEAKPNTGYRFVRWSGDGTGASARTVTMETDRSVTAHFESTLACDGNTFVFEVGRSSRKTLSAARNGSGAITYSDGRGRPTWLAFDAPTHAVSGTAPAAGTWAFSTVATDADGNKANCKHYVVGIRIQHRVNVTVSPNTAWGSVSKSPAGPSYYYNDRVTLRANANPGYRFVRWSGAASGTSATARVTMNGNKTAKAHFELIPLPPCDPSVPGSCACPPGFPICGNAGDEGG